MILELINICKTYDQGKLQVPVLKDVSLSVEEGEYLAIMGPSGSGKTTLMNIIGCLDSPTSGEYWLEGEELSRLNDNRLSQVRLRSIGFVFQSFHLLSRQTAIENVALPLLYAGVRKKERLEIAKSALERVGLGDRVNFKPTQLSGGQCQRVAIARAIVNNPKILLADEPTGALDTKSGEQIMELFKKLNDEGVTIVMITHEPEIAAHAQRTLNIRDGNLIDPQQSAEASPAPMRNLDDLAQTQVYRFDLRDIHAELESEAATADEKPYHESSMRELLAEPLEVIDSAARVVTPIEITEPFMRGQNDEIDIENIDVEIESAEAYSVDRREQPETSPAADEAEPAMETEGEADIEQDFEDRVPFDTASFEFISQPEPENRQGQFGAPMKTEIDLSSAFGKSVPSNSAAESPKEEAGHQKLIEINDLGLNSGKSSARREDDQ